MASEKNSFLNDFSHHAYAVAGDSSEVIPRIVSALAREAGIIHEGNPDIRIERHERMGIAEAHALKEAAERTALTSGKKIFIIAAVGITSEAQNALLKIVEEPPKDTHFFFVLPSLEGLLPTLRSRLEILRGADTPPERDTLAAASAFLASGIPVRLKTVQSLLKEAEDTERKGELTDFLDALERVLAKDTAGNAKALASVLEVKKYSRDRAPSFKLLLEHLALVLPKM